MYPPSIIVKVGAIDCFAAVCVIHPLPYIIEHILTERCTRRGKRGIGGVGRRGGVQYMAAAMIKTLSI